MTVYTHYVHNNHNPNQGLCYLTIIQLSFGIKKKKKSAMYVEDCSGRPTREARNQHYTQTLILTIVSGS
jgi:hypothetical protein